MRVLVAGWIGSTNLGDELVFSGLRTKLAIRGAEVVALSQQPAATERAHGVRAVSGRSPAALIGALAGADRLAFGGGGLLQDETSPFNLPYHLARAAAARLRRTPFAVIGVGAGRLDTRVGRALVSGALRGRALRGVSVRDADSAALLTRLGVRAPVVAADLAFALAPPVEHVRDEVVVALRPWSAGRTRTPAAARAARLPEAFVAAFASALDGIASTGLTVRFAAFQRDRDDAVHRAVAARMSAPAEIEAPGLHDVLAVVARARVVVAMRYHAAVAATLAGRPAVLVGYSPKVDALAGELGAGGRLLAFEPPAVAGLVRAVEGVAGHEPAVATARDRLRERERGNDAVIDRLLDDR